MSLTLWNKIGIFLKVIFILKNWKIVPLTYFGKIQSEYVNLISRSGVIIKIRNLPSTDIHIFTEIWINKEYYEEGFIVKDSDVIIDIGSHIGLFALWATQNCKKSKIICVEPESNNFKILQENINENKITNAICYNAAASDNLGKIKITQNEQDSASHSIFKKGRKFFECDSITIKKIFELNDIKQCNLLKLDCEGAEYEILLNLEKKYFEKIDKICLEYHINEKLELNQNNLINHLQKQNYKVSSVKSSKKSGLIFAKKLK